MESKKGSGKIKYLLRVCLSHVPRGPTHVLKGAHYEKAGVEVIRQSEQHMQGSWGQGRASVVWNEREGQ